MTLINKPAIIFSSAAAAERIAEAVREGDSEGWTYEVEELASGKAKIAVFDEQGFEIGYL